MSTSIIGFGPVGKAIAGQFARKGLDVTAAARRAPDQIAAEVRAVGPTVKPATLKDAVTADTVILAIPFSQHQDVGAVTGSWDGKLVIDATNAYGTPLKEFGGLSASAFAAKKYPGAMFVKAFNHLPAAKLAADPAVNGGRRVIFVSTDDAAALEPAKDLLKRLGYAPVSLGTLAESGPLTQAREDRWSPLNFQDVVKFDAD